MRYVFDTSAVIYLLEKWQLADKLQKFSRSNELCIPERVKEEFLSGEVDPPNVTSLAKTFHVCRVHLDDRLLSFFNHDSFDGAIHVMSYGLRHSNSCCVIAEKFGRDLCEFLTQKMGLRLRFTGTIGILKKMKKSGILSKRDLACIKSGIRNSRFYCKRELLNELDLPE